MVCHRCKAERVLKGGQDYHLTISGLDNVFLKNATVSECDCDRAIVLSLHSRKLSVAIVGQLIAKPMLLTTREFRVIWKSLASLAEVDRDFAMFIGFKNQDMLKFNDFSKLDTSSEESRQRTILLMNSADDALINQLCCEEITQNIARLLGLENRQVMFKIGKTQPVSRISFELDALTRGLADWAMTAEKHEAYSEFDAEGNQTIYVVMDDL